jgi:hypothetical protein
LLVAELTFPFIDEHNVLWIMSVMPLTTSPWLLVQDLDFLTVLTAEKVLSF